MRRTRRTFHFIVLVLLIVNCASAKAEENRNGKEEGKKLSIGISISEFRNENGMALITLYNTEDTWTEIGKAYRKIRQKIKGKSMWVEFVDLPPGTYAIYVLHDENENNEMDMKWFPYPRPGEGVGASNNYKGRSKWKHAKFALGQENKKLKIQLKYF